MQLTQFRLKLYTESRDTRRAFYEQLLGWKVLREWDRGEADWGIMYEPIPGTILELLPLEERLSIVSSADLSLQVEDVDALWLALKDKAQLVLPLRDNAWGDRSFCIVDPEGLELVFFSPV